MQYLPRVNRRGDAFDLDSAEVAVFEQIADQPARARGDDNSAGLGQHLQPGGEVGRLADHRLFLRRSFADLIPDDHQSSGDPDPGLELDGPDIEATDSVNQAQPRPNRLLGIVLMRSRVAKIGEHAVAHVPGDKAVGLLDHFGDSTVIGGHDLSEILGIEPRRESGRADKVAEHHGQLPSCGGGIDDFPILCR